MVASVIKFTNGVAPAAPAAGLADIYHNATKQFCSLNDAGFEISDPVVRENEIRAVRSQVSGGLVASPAATASLIGVMLGCSNITAACIITPQVTGRVLIMVNGVVAGDTSGDGAAWHIRTGTGAAPAAGAAATGTQAGGQESVTFLTGVLKVPFAIQAVVTGLALGTAAWIDLWFEAVTGGNVTMTQVNVSAIEL